MFLVKRLGMAAKAESFAAYEGTNEQQNTNFVRVIYNSLKPPKMG